MTRKYRPHLELYRCTQFDRPNETPEQTTIRQAQRLAKNNPTYPADAWVRQVRPEHWELFKREYNTQIAQLQGVAA